MAGYLDVFEVYFEKKINTRVMKSPRKNFDQHEELPQYGYSIPIMFTLYHNIIMLSVEFPSAHHLSLYSH